MKEKNQKIIMISNIITLVCGIIALFLLLKGGVDFMNPIIWLMGALVLSSLSALITQYLNKK